ncbi:hypothetical protein Btaycd_007950 [Bartonella taylorii]|nr:hypothetical protein [Bartonella taylorii]OPB35153.1 hypothetical protein Btaycd_007950 [Bartonella taylorii]
MIVTRNGEIVKHGSADSIFSHYQNSYMQALMTIVFALESYRL